MSFPKWFCLQIDKSPLNPKKILLTQEYTNDISEFKGLALRQPETSKTRKLKCLRLVWRILTSTPSMWVKWIQTYLICDENLWSIKYKTSKWSWMWRKILKYRDVALGFFNKEVKSDCQTSFSGLITKKTKKKNFAK